MGGQLLGAQFRSSTSWANHVCQQLVRSNVAHGEGSAEARVPGKKNFRHGLNRVKIPFGSSMFLSCIARCCCPIPTLEVEEERPRASDGGHLLLFAGQD
jgi:hypothetical protein